MPSCYDYTSIEEYEEGLLIWRDNVDDIFQSIHLPSILGDYFYRPQVYADLQADYSISGMDISAIEESAMESTLEEYQSSYETDASSFEDIVHISEKVSNKILENIPWNAQLIPVEPDPQDYDDFESYEEALHKWAYVCSSISTIPPHPEQLEELIPIQSFRRTSTDDENDSLLSYYTLVQPPELGLIYFQYWENPYQAHSHIKSDYGGNRYKRRVKISRVTKRKLERSFTVIQNTYKGSIRKYLSCPVPIIGRLHGLLNNNPNFIEGHILRRLDLTDENIYENTDCPKSHRITYSVPRYYLNEVDNILAVEDRNYAKQKNMEYLKMFHENEKYPFMQFWNPNLKEKMDELYEKLIDSLKDKQKVKLSLVKDILTGPLLLDKFSEMLEEDGCILLNLRSSTIDNFTDIVVYSGSANAKYKTSVYIKKFMHNDRGVSVYNNIMEDVNVKLFYELLYSIYFSEDMPTEIFPYPEEYLTLLYQISGKRSKYYQKLFSHFFPLYYQISLLNFVEGKDDYLPLMEKIQSDVEGLKKKLIKHLSTKNRFPKVIGEYVGHRSKHISSLFTFVFMKLLRYNIIDLRTIENGIIVEELSKLAERSKMPHVKENLRQIMQYILENNPIVFYEHWTNIENFISDIYSPIVYSDLITEKTMDDFSKMCKGESIHNSIEELLVKEGFTTILNAIKDHPRNVGKKTLNASLLLKNLIKTNYCVEEITINVLKGAGKSKKAKMEHIDVETRYDLEKETIIEMMIYCEEVTGRDRKIVDQIKANMLASVSELLRFKDIFKLVGFDGDVHERLNNFCKCDVDPVCKEAWKLFYRLIKNNADYVEYLEENRYLGNYLGQISTGNSIVVVKNGLHYLTKLFELPPRLNKKGKPETKSTENDMKLISNFFSQKSLFRKIHTIYKRFSLNYSGSGFFVTFHF
eukprot:TRINITY_DN865_c0_g1_i1.p1 TRINITY_DN865_c0_g1~~TRINITY_DN865_c0_g1_i1.p1  ORF type:complete len:1000 (+),score=201.56 TRINITY_DN865_c0_g1_i1:239-3001(+)